MNAFTSPSFETPARRAYSIAPLEARHVPELCDIHLASWAPFEISVQLGRGYVERFYRTIAGSPTAFGFVGILDSRVAGYATGFWDYPRFFEELLRGYRLRFYGTLAARLLAGRLSWKDVAEARAAAHVEKQLKHVRWHQNGLALLPEVRGTTLGKQLITDLIQCVLSRFRDANVPGCWGRTDARNQRMCAYYRKLGFTEVAPPATQNSRYVYFEASWS